MFGFLNIYKPKGKTSHDVVAILRRVTKIKQIGHTGTLDPFAEGVLPVCIGKATRLIEYLADDKAYIGTVQLGKSTTTYDMKDKQIAKVEIASKQMPNAEITIEYNINITNNGETDEYITNIRDIPSEGELVQEDSNWSVEGENLINNSLAGEPIKAGETKTLKLKLKTTVDDEGTAKTINNKVEAMENNNADNVSNINTDKIVISVHGMTSNCLKKRDTEIAKKVNEIGVDYFCFNNRGHDVISYYSIQTGKGKKKQMGGTAFEDPEEGYYDIIGAINILLIKIIFATNFNFISICIC